MPQPLNSASITFARVPIRLYLVNVPGAGGYLEIVSSSRGGLLCRTGYPRMNQGDYNHGKPKHRGTDEQPQVEVQIPRQPVKDPHPTTSS
ncbi:MAG TPA: hypothetical protein VMH81_38785 [Bryobacteraceae bacterium]|nr:hypothetical protein [Bryobacteraceae bacterium]